MPPRLSTSFAEQLLKTARADARLVLTPTTIRLLRRSAGHGRSGLVTVTEAASFDGTVVRARSVCPCSLPHSACRCC